MVFILFSPNTWKRVAKILINISRNQESPSKLIFLRQQQPFSTTQIRRELRPWWYVLTVGPGIWGLGFFPVISSLFSLCCAHVYTPEQLTIRPLGHSVCTVTFPQLHTSEFSNLPLSPLFSPNSFYSSSNPLSNLCSTFFLSHLFLIPMSFCCFITINLPASWSGRKTSVQRSLLVTVINLPPKSTASFLPQSRNNFSLQLKHGFMALCQWFYSHTPLFNS